MTPHDQTEVAVLMRLEAVQGPMARWQSSRWVLADVVPHVASFGDQPKCLRQTDDGSLWLYPGIALGLYTDDAEGYWLNVTSPVPCYFVMWRLMDAVEGSQPLAVPQAVSLSYHDAGRWLDAQETVETIAAPPSVVDWVRAFVAEHFVPEVKKRQRPQSFQRLTDRFGQPVSVSTQDKRKGVGGAPKPNVDGAHSL